MQCLHRIFPQDLAASRVMTKNRRYLQKLSARSHAGNPVTKSRSQRPAANVCLIHPKGFKLLQRKLIIAGC